jgi:CMP-N,N'-diacetyllegionaminic acid synthase
MSRKKITAVVPIRKGSQRIIDKNFIPFVDGKSLLEVKLEMLKKITLIDEIIVNTDSQRAMDIADKYGVSKKRRETYYASNECTNSEFFENMAKTTDTDYLIYSPCTAPLVKESTYYDFINRFINGIDNGYDSLTTVNVLKHHMWLDDKPLNYDPMNSPNTQDLPDIYKLTYSLSIIDRNVMIDSKHIIGYKPHFYEIDDVEGVDVDNQIDFDFGKFLYRRFTK